MRGQLGLSRRAWGRWPQAQWRVARLQGLLPQLALGWARVLLLLVPAALLCQSRQPVNPHRKQQELFERKVGVWSWHGAFKNEGLKMNCSHKLEWQKLWIASFAATQLRCECNTRCFQLCVNAALRLLTNASMPSFWSWVAKSAWKIRRSNMMPSDRPDSKARLIDSLAAITAICE